MNFFRTISILLVAILLSTISFGQDTKPTNYFGLDNALTFDKIDYNLIWTSHPSDNYYKHEYLQEGDNVDKFKKLISIEALVGQIKIEDIVSAKVSELKKIKESNPIVNFEIFEKDGEVILDFLISANTPDGKRIAIVERNVYRYKSIKEKNGRNCLFLFAVSERAYDDEIEKFIFNLKENRYDLINLVSQFELPEITLNN